MARSPGDQPVSNEIGTGRDDAQIEASRTLLAAAEPRIWSRNDGRRYDGAPTDATPGVQNQRVDIPTVGGNTLRIDPRGQFVDIIGPDGRGAGRERLQQDAPTRLKFGNTVIAINPDRSVDAPTAKGFERTHPNLMRENFEKTGDNYVLTERRFADNSFEKYSNGKLTETNKSGFVTKFDEAGRKTEVTTPGGDRYAFKYGRNGVENYEITRKGSDGQPQVMEKGTRGADGKLNIERRANDGSMKSVNLRDRTDVVLRPDLKMDYLDKDGYGLPDNVGRMVKRDDRTVLVQGTGADGRPIGVPVNPVRSVRFSDGRTIDYEYSADKFREKGKASPNDTLSSYTVRDAQGKIIEFAQRIPDIPDTQRNGQANWFEFKAKPGQSLPADQVNKVKTALEPADPNALADPQKRAEVRAEMLARRTALMKDRPMVEFMPTDKNMVTTQVAVDHISGRQYNVYANGETFGKNERGEDFLASRDQNTGELLERYADGRTFRRAVDADLSKHRLHRTTVTRAGNDGVPRLEFHHSRADNSFINVNYGADNKTPSELIVTPPGGTQIRMAPDASNPAVWNEFVPNPNWKQGDPADQRWKPTGKAFPMKVDIVDAATQLSMNGRPLPPGSMVLSQGDKKRVITPYGEDVRGTVTRTPEQQPGGVPQDVPNRRGPAPQRQEQPPVRRPPARR